MPYQLRDSYLEELTPGKISNYAKHSGWERVAYDDRDVEILRDRQGREIWLPLTTDFRDYEIRIGESVELLAESEGRDPKSVADEIVQPASDIIRFGLSSRKTGVGTIPLSDGIEFYRQSMLSLEAAANEASNPGQRYFQDSSKKAKQYIRACQLGASEEGSYVGKIISPIHIELDKSLEEQGEGETFSRQATRRFMTSVNLVLGYINEGNVRSITKPEDGQFPVSGNLCEAIASMLSLGGSPSIRIQFSHTKTAPVADFPVRTLEINRQHFNPLKEIVRELKTLDKPVERLFHGRVQSLRGKENTQGKMEGLVRLLVDVSNVGEVKASIQLNPSDYKRAGKAHIQNQSIEVKGRLRLKDRKDKIHTFERYESFELS